MQRNVQHVLLLVGGVLSLLRAESGQVEYALADVPLDDVLGFVEEATGPQFAAKHLKRERLGRRGLVVRADPAKLRQILLNLVSNAIKFTPDGGTITINCALDDQHVRIEVRDAGPGSPPTRSNAFFNHSSRLDRDPRRQRREPAWVSRSAASMRVVWVVTFAPRVNPAPVRRSSFSCRITEPASI